MSHISPQIHSGYFHVITFLWMNQKKQFLFILNYLLQVIGQVFLYINLQTSIQDWVPRLSIILLGHLRLKKQIKLKLTSRGLLFFASITSGLFLIYHALDIWIFMNPPNTYPFESGNFTNLYTYRFFIDKVIDFLFFCCFGLGIFGLITITKIFIDVERNIITITSANPEKFDGHHPNENKGSNSYQPKKVIQLERWFSKASTLLIYLFVISGIMPTKYLYDIVRSFLPGRLDMIILSWVVSIIIAIVNITVNIIVFRSLLNFLGKVLLINMDFEQNTKQIVDLLSSPDLISF